MEQELPMVYQDGEGVLEGASETTCGAKEGNRLEAKNVPISILFWYFSRLLKILKFISADQTYITDARFPSICWISPRAGEDQRIFWHSKITTGNPFPNRKYQVEQRKQEWCTCPNVTFPDQKQHSSKSLKFGPDRVPMTKPMGQGCLGPYSSKYKEFFSSPRLGKCGQGIPGPVLVEIYRKSLSRTLPFIHFK